MQEHWLREFSVGEFKILHWIQFVLEWEISCNFQEAFTATQVLMLTLHSQTNKTFYKDHQIVDSVIFLLIFNF